MLCYITAAFGLISLLLGGAVYLVPTLLGVGGYGVANERRWGYVMATVLALLNVLTGIVLLVVVPGLSVLNLLFAVVLAALLLHPQSREYQRTWFR